MFDKAMIDTGAGKVEIETLACDVLELSLGAGKADIKNLTANSNANIDGGAGELNIDGGKLCNLDLDMGVGKLTLKSRIEGKSDLDYGVGETDLILLGSKDDYENIYYIVDTVNTAINNKKQISFQYFSFNVRKQKKAKHNGELYVFSPYYLIWNGDYYYTVGYSEKHNGIGSFRLDRIIKTPTILEKEAIKMPTDFNINKYINTSFRMYNSKTESVELICDNSVMDAIIDRLGEDVQTYANDMQTFRAMVDVSVNHVFYGWVFGFAGKVKIKSPKEFKDQYYIMLEAAK